MPTYKPRTAQQLKVLEYLKSHCDIDAFIVSPISRNGLMLEDQDGEQIAFVWHRGRVAECAVPRPSSSSAQRHFEACFQLLFPEPAEQTFDARTTVWLDAPYLVTYQQALNLTGELFRHYLTQPLLRQEEVRELVKQGSISEDAFHSIVLWYLNGNQAEHYLDLNSFDGEGLCFDLIFRCHQADAEHLQFYVAG